SDLVTGVQTCALPILVPEPVSWLMIEPGWKVVAADGTEIGRVEDVTGDSNADIFNGLSISTGLLARPRYVPAELVAEIFEGSVQIGSASCRYRVEMWR